MRSHIGVIVALLFLAACGSANTATNGQPKGQSAGDSNDTNAADSVSAMDAGDLYYISFDANGEALVNFSGGETGAQYTLIVQSTSSASDTITITSQDVSPNIATAFDNFLRANEQELAEDHLPVTPSTSISKSIAKAIGDTANFKVLSSITSTTSYQTVTATLKCIGDTVMVYIDNEVTLDILDDSDIETLCGQFEMATSLEESILGEPSDVNGDEHIVTLITPAVNQLGASGGGIITGYFYASDLFESSASNPTSNEMEIIYILAPDPYGDSGTVITKEFAMSNLMTAVVPHEFQHAINYNQHVLVNSGSTEESWLNEALSHFAEDLVGFGQENPSRVEVYLESPGNVSLAAAGSPDLAERGAGYLFLRFIYERAANQNAFLSALENTPNTGEENVVAAFSGSDSGFDEWTEFMRRWAIAIALTNTGVSSTAQYQFNDRVRNADTGHWQGVCLICDAEDGRGTILSGPYMQELSSGNIQLSIAGTATAFYTISSPPNYLTITGDSSSALQGVLIRME